MKTKKLSKKLSRQQFLRMMIALFLFSFSGILIYLIAISVFSLFTWEPENPIWQLAVSLNQGRFIIGLLYYITGYILIIRHYWFKPFRYFQEVIDATEIVNRQDDTLVELSPVLSELEGELNQIKVNSLANHRAAKEAEQRKNDLITYLAHDLKTPITSVIGYLTLLRDEPQISEEMRKRYLTIALDKAERLDDLINEFFEITRFNLSHIDLEKQVINLSLMLEQLVYEFQPMLRDKNLTCNLDVQENISIVCDSDKLQRVFDNLLRNAVNYSFTDSEIKISAFRMTAQSEAAVCEKEEEKSEEALQSVKSLQPGQIAGELAASQAGKNLQGDKFTRDSAVSPDVTSDYVRISFENKGDTISKEKLGRLFEQFFRLDTSRSSKSGGAGLGLAISKEIIELHGGSIRAFSENNTIRFDVTLPL